MYQPRTPPLAPSDHRSCHIDLLREVVKLLRSFSEGKVDVVVNEGPQLHPSLDKILHTRSGTF